MSFEQEYGSLSYSDGLPDYYGLPLEQINKTYEVLNQKYEINLQKWSQLRANIANSAILSTEQASIDKALAKANTDMKNIVDTGNFHLADLTVNDAINNFTMDKDMKAAFTKKASKESYYAMLDDGVKNKRFLAGDAEKEKKRWESLNQNYTHYNEKGELINSVQQETPQDFVDVAKMFVDLGNSLKGKDLNMWDAFQGVQAGMKNKNMTLAEYYKFVTEDIGVSDERHLAVMQMVMEDPRVKGYNTYKMGLDMMTDYGVTTLGKSTYQVDNYGRIKMRELGWNELNAQGLIRSDDGKQIYRTRIVRNNKGQMLTKAGGITDNPNLADRQVVSTYKSDPLREQESIYNAITLERFKAIGEKYTSFATAYSWNTTKYTFEESSNREANAARKIKAQDNIPMTVTPTLTNKEGHEGVGDILKESEYKASTFIDGARNLYNTIFPGAQSPLDAINFMKDPKAYAKIKAMSSENSTKGQAAREYISMIEDNMQQTVANNSYLNTLFNTANNKYNLGLDISPITTKFTEKGAPLNAFIIAGSDPKSATVATLTEEAKTYCLRNGIPATKEAFIKHMDLTPAEVQTLKTGSIIANKPIGKQAAVTVKNKTMYSLFSGYNDQYSEKDIASNIKQAMKEVTSNSNSTGTILQSDGSVGFGRGNKVTLANYANILYANYGVKKSDFNNAIKQYFEGKETGVRSFETSDKKTITIEASEKAGVADGIGVMVPLIISVKSEKGQQVSNVVIGYSAGKHGTGKTLTSPVFEQFENPMLIAEQTIKNTRASGTDKVGNSYMNDKGQIVPGFKFNASNGFEYFAKDQVGPQPLQETTINGTQYYISTDVDKSTILYEKLLRKK